MNAIKTMIQWVNKNGKWLFPLILNLYDVASGIIKARKGKNKPVAGNQVPVEPTEPVTVAEKDSVIVDKNLPAKARKKSK